MSRILTRLTLAGSGTLLGLIGSALLVAPRSFLEMSHVFIDTNPGLISELTAPSVLLIMAGSIMVLGAVKSHFAQPALLTGAVVFGSYGLSRLISMALHGLPSPSLIAAMVLELVIAALLFGLNFKAFSRKNPREI